MSPDPYFMTPYFFAGRQEVANTRNAPFSASVKICRLTPISLFLASIKDGLDALSGSRKQATLFSLIPQMDQVLHKHQNESNGVQDYTQEARNWLEHLFPPLFHSMAEYLVQQNGEISGDLLEKFITVLSTEGFFRECDWEGDKVPMWSTDLFIANPDGVISILKARPWQCAQKFIGGNDAAADQFLGGYGSDETALSKVLIPKYVKNKKMLWAKFNELKGWVVQQEKQVKSKK